MRQLISSHMLRRVAMCCLSSAHGKRQHLAVSHEKGKVTILQLSALLRQADSSKRKLTLTVCSVLFVVPLLLSLLSGVRLVVVICSSSFCSSPHFSLAVSNSYLYLLFSNLLPLSSHHILGLPHLLFPSTLGICYLCQFFISQSFHMSNPFQPNPHHFLLKTPSFHPPPLFALSVIIHVKADFSVASITLAPRGGSTS